MRRPAGSARRVAGRLQAELLGAGAIEQPGLQHAVLDHRDARVGDAFAVERLGAQAANPVRIVNDGDGGREDLLAHPVLEEADAAGDGGAGNRARQMAQQAGGYARIEDHRQRPAT